MSRVRSEVLDWFAARLVVPGKELDTLRIAGMIPSPAQWRTFLGNLALWLGIIAVAAALISFFAFNWQDISRFTKFGLVEALVVGALVTGWRVGLDGMAGKAVLTFLCLLVGALLALVGQIYQTGADTYELFALWSVLILPWVMVSRFVPLWLIWLCLLNVAAILYFSLGRAEERVFWAPFLLNSLALVAWEAAHRSGLSWVKEDWPPRLIAVASALAATALILWAIFDGERGSALLATLVYLAWIAGLYGWYRHVRTDLLMLAAGLLSLVIAVAAFLSNGLLDSGNEGGAFLFIGLTVIGMSALGAFWLRSIAHEEGA